MILKWLFLSIHSKRQIATLSRPEQNCAEVQKDTGYPLDGVLYACCGQVLFVGTKAGEGRAKAAAEKAKKYVTELLIGGMPTNVSTVNQQVKKLKDLERRMDSGDLEKRYNKFERSVSAKKSQNSMLNTVVLKI